jgi:HAD superfamily hydrolase (TIGR01490 family)
MHKEHGAKIVLVSGSFKEILNPIMSYVKADHLMCSELELQGDFYTGCLLKQVIGEGKWQAIREYVRDKNVDLSACYAYGDHKSDLCFMSRVGHPVLVGNSEEMMSIALKNGWAIICRD